MPNRFGGLFAALLKQRMAQQAAAQQAARRAPAMAARTPEPQEEDDSQRYVPQMGTAQSAAAVQPQVITRTVKDPFANPYQKMATGFDIGDRTEKGYVNPKTGEIQWEFADVRPHGGSGGIQGGGAESSLHATEDLQAKMPAYRTGRPDIPPSEVEDAEPNPAVQKSPVAPPRSRRTGGYYNSLQSGSRGLAPVVMGRR